MNAANYFKDQRRLSSRLATVKVRWKSGLSLPLKLTSHYHSEEYTG